MEVLDVTLREVGESVAVVRCLEGAEGSGERRSDWRVWRSFQKGVEQVRKGVLSVWKWLVESIVHWVTWWSRRN